MQQVIIFFHILISLALIGLVLLQQGKGANMGAAFGSGASNTLFGSRGPASFLMKLTGILLIFFFITSLSLGYLAARQANQENQLIPPPAQTQVVPAAPASQSVATPATTMNQAPIILTKS